jgi:hypothetical protein
MNPFYPLIALRAEHRCEYCHSPEVAFNSPFGTAPIVPLSQGSGDESDNLALACRACDGFKSDSLVGTDPEAQSEVSLFHPRNDVWAEHFVVETETLMLQGRPQRGVRLLWFCD